MILFIHKEVFLFMFTKKVSYFVALASLIFFTSVFVLSFTPTPTVNIAYAAEHDLSGFGDDDQDLADGSANEEDQEFFAGDQTVPTGVVPGDFGEISTTPGGGGGNGGGSPPPPQEAGDTSFAPLISLPGVDAGEPVSLSSYLAALMQIGLGLAGVFAVLMLVVAGIQYIGSAGNEGLKGAAKSRITNAIFGLIIAMGSWLLIFIINPAILGGDLQIEKVPLPDSPPVSSVPSFPPLITPSPVSNPGSPFSGGPFVPLPVLGGGGGGGGGFSFESFLPPVVLSNPSDDGSIIQDCLSRSAKDPCVGADIDGDGKVSNPDFVFFNQTTQRYDVNGDGTILLAAAPKIKSCLFKINTSDIPKPILGFQGNLLFESLSFSTDCAVDEYGTESFDVGVINRLRTIISNSIPVSIFVDDKIVSLARAYDNLFVCNFSQLCNFLKFKIGFDRGGQGLLFRFDDINFSMSEIQNIDLTDQTGLIYRTRFCTETFSQCSTFFNEEFLKNETKLLCETRFFGPDFLYCLLTNPSSDPANESGLNHLMFSCERGKPNCYSLSSDATARIVFATLKRMDTNNDDLVDFKQDGDRAVVNQCIGNDIAGSCANADMNADGKIDSSDLLLWDFFDENIFSENITFFRPDFTIGDTEAEFFDAEGYEDRQIIEYCLGKKQIGDCSTSDVNGDFLINDADLADFDTSVKALDTNNDGVVNFSSGFGGIVVPTTASQSQAVVIANCIGEPVEGECADADINGDGVIDTTDFNEFTESQVGQ